MENFREGFTSFWETLTGVLNDDRSKFIRLSAFGVLLLGIIWAGLNYFQAERIADLDEDIYSSSSSVPTNRSNETLNKLTEFAQTIGTMRRGGKAVADSISSMNTMPFNIEGYNAIGLEELNTTTTNFQQVHTDGQAPELQPEQEKPAPQLMVKALMLSDSSRYAVIDYAGKKGQVIRQGQKLPDSEGRVIKINQEGITVKLDNKEIIYTVK